jgi:hypothetical protein
MTWPRKKTIISHTTSHTVENQFFSEHMQSLAIVFIANELISSIRGCFLNFFIKNKLKLFLQLVEFQKKNQLHGLNVSGIHVN